MIRISVLFVAAMLLVGFVACPAFAATEAPASPATQAEGILLASHSHTFVSGKLHFGMNGNWAHLRDFIWPASCPRDISPDNKYLVGTGSFGMEPTQILLWDLTKDKIGVIGEHLYDIAGTELRFSPAGDKVLFYSGTPEMRGITPIEGIYLIDLTTRVTTLITSPNLKSRVENARWSGDGQQVMYVEWLYDDEMWNNFIGTEIRTHNLLTGETKTIVKMDNNVIIQGFEPVPDSNQLVMNLSRRDGTYQLILYDYDTGKCDVLVSGPIILGSISPVKELSVSPNGDKLAYAIYTSEYESGQLWRLAVIDLLNKTQTVIADNIISSGQLYGLDPVWSPDGRGLMYIVAGDWDEGNALAVVPDITKPKEKELFYAEEQIYFYTWVTPASKQIAFKGPTGISPEVVGYDLWAPHLVRHIPLGTVTMQKDGLEFGLTLVPSRTPECTDRLALDVVVRKDGRLVKSGVMDGTMWAWVGDVGHGKGPVSPFKGHLLLNDFYDPEWGRVTVEFEGTYAGQPMTVRSSGTLGLDR